MVGSVELEPSPGVGVVGGASTVPFLISAFSISAETRGFQHRVCPTCQNLISAIFNSAGAAVGTPCQNESFRFHLFFDF